MHSWNNTSRITGTTLIANVNMANMFGALNRFISRLDAEPQGQHQQQRGTQGAYGFQVLRNSNAELPLDPWFDFIVGINGRTLVRTLIL